jgi:DNA polymerase-1
MEIKAEYIRDAESVAKFRDEILAAPAIGVDTETTGFNPLQDRLRLVQIATGPERCFIFDTYDIPQSELFFLNDIFADEQKPKYFQNGKFDMKFLMHQLGSGAFPTIFDTYLASVLIACGDGSVRHGLGVLADHYAGIDLPKDEQKSDFDAPVLSEAQLAYAARDACILFPIADKQRKFLRALDLERAGLLEFDCVEAVADLELRGIYLNAEEWRNRCERQHAQLIDLSGVLMEHFKTVAPVSLFDEVDVDLESPVKLLPLLNKLGVPVESTMEDELRPHKDRFPVVKALLDYREVSSALKLHGPEYLKFIDPYDGRIHADFRQIGTPTGRFICQSPNLQQVPKEDLYRNSFQAQGEGKGLIIADYSMIELRIMAEFSRDEKLLEAFHNDIDLHQYTGSRAFGLPLEAAAKGTEQRQIGKMGNFAATYGTGARRFSAFTGLAVKKSEEVLKAFWGLYTGLKAYMDEAGARAVEEHEIRSFSGRTWRLDYDPTDHQSIAAVDRLGRNFPIQATCSDIMKRSMYFQRNKTRGRDAGLVNVVHDEGVTEFLLAEEQEIREIVSTSMIKAAEEVLTVVPAKIDLNVSSMWKK